MPSSGATRSVAAIEPANFATWAEPPVAGALFENNPVTNDNDPFRDFRPVTGRTGSTCPLPNDRVWSHPALQVLAQAIDRARIAVCITLYNERGCEVQATLESLEACAACLHAASSGALVQHELVVVLIQDGCVHPTNGNAIIDPTTRELLELDGTLPSVWTPNTHHSRLTAVVAHSPDVEGATMRTAPGRWHRKYPHLNKALIVSKGPNRRKYNSHGWFFGACKGLLKPDYAFLTDAGTMYKRDCLRKLVGALDDNDDLVAVTARQRSMTPGNMPEYDSSYGSWLKWLFASPAMAQAMEYETTFILNTAAFSMLGMLPVLPGPCQLIRWRYTEEAFEQYLGIIEPTNNDGFIKALLRLAEDRVLSALVVLRSGRRTVWVPGATFYYPPEMSLASLIAQRRRWNNGTLAANLYLLIDPDHAVVDGQVPGGRATTCMWYFQLYQAATTVMSPAIFAGAVQASVLDLDHRSYGGGLLARLRHSQFWGAPEIAATSFFAVYLVWMLCAHFVKVSDGWASRLLQYFVFAVSVATMCLILFTMVWVSTYDGEFEAIDVLVLSALLVPPLAGSIQSVRAAVLYLLYLPLTLPTVCFHVCFVPSYGLARLSELSWGTKDTGPEAVSAEQKQHYKRKGGRAFMALLAANALVFVAFLVSDDAGAVTSTVKIAGYVVVLIPLFLHFTCSLLYFLKRAIVSAYVACARSDNNNRRPASSGARAALLENEHGRQYDGRSPDGIGGR